MMVGAARTLPKNNKRTLVGSSCVRREVCETKERKKKKRVASKKRDGCGKCERELVVVVAAGVWTAMKWYVSMMVG